MFGDIAQNHESFKRKTLFFLKVNCFFCLMIHSKVFIFLYSLFNTQVCEENKGFLFETANFCGYATSEGIFMGKLNHKHTLLHLYCHSLENTNLLN